MTSQAVTTTTVPRSRRLRDSAANGSAHRTYQGISQLTQTTASNPAHPVGPVQLRVRQATAAQAATPANSTAPATARTVASAPPRPSA